jgi:phosphoribosylformylglycinamidine synthase
VCSGGRPLAATNCLNFGNPEHPEVMWQFSEVVDGMSEACSFFGTPITGGNVSFYNETENQAIYPTPVVGMLGIVNRPNRENPPVGIGFQKEGDLIILLGETLPELGGTEWLKVIQGQIRGIPPELNIELEKSVQKTCITLIREGIVKSAHDLSEGGLGVTLVESILQGAPGAQGAAVSLMPELPSLYLLFSESQSRILITVEPDQVFAFQSIAQRFGAPFEIIGKVEGQGLILKRGLHTLLHLTYAALNHAYEGAIPSLLAGTTQRGI